jgi:transcriptional regulator with XRE-family HTH domain
VRRRGSTESQHVLRLFGYRLRELRVRRGLSQMQLALAADIHPTYISALERGKRNVTLLYLMQLAAALDTSAAELIPSVDD